MKNLLIIMILGLGLSVAAQEKCGQTKVVVTKAESTVEVNTETPKSLRGATIKVTKADGTSSEVKSDDFMLVPRKHKRSVIKETVKESEVACKMEPAREVIVKQPEEHNNILSLGLVDGYGKLERTEGPIESSVKVKEMLGLSLQYQRQITERLYLGGTADTNKNLGLGLGIGF